MLLSFTNDILWQTNHIKMLQLDITGDLLTIQPLKRTGSPFLDYSDLLEKESSIGVYICTFLKLRIHFRVFFAKNSL